MILKTRGIVLRTVKYGESSLIITVYTEKFGRQSYIVNATRGIKARNKVVFMQPLFLLDLEVYHKQNRDVQRIKEIRLADPYITIPFQITKSVQTVFLSEVLYKILQEEESNPALYMFIENSLQYFDTMEDGSVNFHIWFLSRLTEYIGVLPYAGDLKKGWFDMQKGMIMEQKPLHTDFMNPDTSKYLLELLTLNINDLHNIKINREQRNQLLIKQLEYLHLHFQNLGHVKSFSVLKEVFE